MQDDIDLSSFPLLRIDQIHRHETQTLVESEVQLAALEHEAAVEHEAAACFISKLRTRIRNEIDNREEKDKIQRNESVGSLSGNASSTMPSSPAPSEHDRNDSFPSPTRVAACSLPSTSTMISPKRSNREPRVANVLRKQPPSARHASSPSAEAPSQSNQRPKRQAKIGTSRQPAFFVSNSPKSKSSSFRSRAKLAKASLKARSDEVTTRQLEQKRHERTREVLETMRDRRMERSSDKKHREKILEEEKELRRQRWKERREREKHMRTTMHAVAEEAKSKALESGCTNEEAIVEAAAAAAKVVDDELTMFQSENADSDEESLSSMLSSDIAVIHDDLDVANAGDNAPASASENWQHQNEIDDVDSCSSVLESENHQLGNVVAADTTTKPQLHPDCIEQADSIIHNTANNSAQHKPVRHGTEQENNPSTDEKALEIPSLTSPNAIDEDARSTQSESCGTASADQNVHASADELISLLSLQLDEPLVQPKPLGEAQSDTTLTLPHENHHLHKSADEKISTEDAKPTKDRKFCNVFSSFSDIFSALASGKRQKSTADVKQRELSKSLQNQIGQYTRMSAAFATHGDSDDDDDLSDTSVSFNQGLFYRIHSRRPEIQNIIRKAFANHTLFSWDELSLDIEDPNWNLMWVWGLPKASDFEHLMVFQKINRFLNTRGLTRKDLLKKNIQRFSNKTSSRDEDSFNIMPLTYALPHEFNSFVSGYQSIQKISGSKAVNFWIIKPVGLSRGRGISLVNDLADVSYSQPIVIQRYIADPLCFMGFKFDLRIYVLVTSFSPLEAFIYKEGLARFGSRQYSSRPEFLHDNRIHLTNSSIQREYGDDIDRSHPAYMAGSNGSGNKTAFSWLWKRLEGLGISTNALWLKIVDVCRKALFTSGSDIQHQPNSFEVFGFDLMFDQHLRCWLIEVNSSPSFGCDSPLDTRVKGSLIRDTIALVDPPAYDRKVLADVCKRRMTHRKPVLGISSKDVLEKDLAQILKNKVPRVFSEMPKRMGNFERIAPLSRGT